MGETPILDALTQHIQKARLPLHVPGHKQGKYLPRTLSHWLGPAAKLDLTELPGLDNLMEPEGCIRESQQLAAAHYGSDTCLYSVNGSTACIMAALMGVATPSRRVLFVNSFHMSAWRGLVFADALPSFPLFQGAHTGVIEPQSMVQRLRSLLQEDHDYAAIYVTSPTYIGEVAPVRELAEVAHQYGIPLIVDEAHGAHFGLSRGLPPHSVECGADVVVQSVHKMLPGLTQTAWMHVSGSLVSRSRIAEALQLLQSTSPSYLLLASLDAAQAWLRTEGQTVALQGMSVMETLGHFRFAQTSSRDPFRHWIPTVDMAMSRDLQRFFAAYGIYVEYADPMGVLSVFGLAVTNSEMDLYMKALQAWGEHASMSHEPLSQSIVDLPNPAEAEFQLTPKEAHLAKKHLIPLEDSANRVCLDIIAPYPPGVPILYPGQRISTTDVKWLLQSRTNGVQIQGLVQGKIAVLSES